MDGCQSGADRQWRESGRHQVETQERNGGCMHKRKKTCATSLVCPFLLRCVRCMCLTRDGDCSLHRLRPERQLSATRTRDTDKRRHREEGNVSLSLLLSRVCVSCLCLVSCVSECGCMGKVLTAAAVSLRHDTRQPTNTQQQQKQRKRKEERTTGGRREVNKNRSKTMCED